MRPPQEYPFLRLSGGTMTGALNMGAQAITNCGDVSADNAAGFLLENSAATSTNPTIMPNRAAATSGIGAASAGSVNLVSSATNLLAASGSSVTTFVDLYGRGGYSNDSGNVTAETDLVVQGSDADRGGATLTVPLNAMSETLAAAGTHTFTSIIPAGSVVLGVTTRVTTTITGCTSIQIGDGTDADRFGNAIALTAGTTTTNADWTITSLPVYAAATNIVITAVGGGASFTAGAMRVCVYYTRPTAPTS